MAIPMARRGKSSFGAAREDRTTVGCWICEGWAEVSFNFTPFISCQTAEESDEAALHPFPQ